MASYVKQLKILIQGAGIAGTTLAVLLARMGMKVTLVERSPCMRTSGNPVDVRGEAFATAERLGIVPSLRAVATRVERFAFIDARGRTRAEINSRAPGSSREVEVPRADLATALLNALPDDVEVRFADTIVRIDQDETGVNVTSARGIDQHVDLLICCDGLHSSVRALALDGNERHIQALGLYVASVHTTEIANDPTRVLIYNEPDRALVVHPALGSALAMFLFRSGARVGHTDVDAQRMLLQDCYAGGRWRTEELLKAYADTEDVYFDAVCRVSLPRWRDRRVALLGDAASCASLFGNGSSLAMLGAETLADALDRNRGAPTTALALYEAQHRSRVDPYIRRMGMTGRFMVPRTRAGIQLRNFALQLVGR